MQKLVNSDLQRQQEFTNSTSPVPVITGRKKQTDWAYPSYIMVLVRLLAV
jgi:hypothetical protein